MVTTKLNSLVWLVVALGEIDLEKDSSYGPQELVSDEEIAIAVISDQEFKKLYILSRKLIESLPGEPLNELDLELADLAGILRTSYRLELIERLLAAELASCLPDELLIKLEEHGGFAIRVGWIVVLPPLAPPPEARTMSRFSPEREAFASRYEEVYH